MKERIFIEKAEYGSTEGGIACGPVGGIETVSFKLKIKDTTKWLYCTNVMGIPTFHFSDKDIIYAFLSDDADDMELLELRDTYNINKLYGVNLDELRNNCNYAEYYHKHKKNQIVKLLVYMLNIVFHEVRDIKSTLDDTNGKYVDELELWDSWGEY